MTSRALGVLAASTTRAAQRLRKLLDDPQATVRHRAACSILELRIKVTEASEIERRLNEIEKRIEAQSFPRNGVHHACA
jgi:hypothetical protein